MAFSFVYLIVNWSTLPETIAIHFNVRGEADGWGSKAFLFFPLMISLVLYIGLTLLRKIPHHFNYMTTITEQNAPYQYKISLELLSWIKLELVVIFGFLQWAIIQDAKGETSIFSISQLPIAFVILLGTIVFYVIKLKK
ncbi:hypothetical protein BK133_04475 [Paenibacillus sp. FSL H8-0548]|nr:hypothetical protein BK133_04475 [Paenibacillus sp. FSL H8-0548]